MDALKAFGRVKATDEHQECGATAHEQRVGKHAQGLDEALLDGMRHIGRGRHIGRATLARLVTEQAALDTHHDGHAQATASHLLKAESILDNKAQHMGHHVDIHDDDNQGQDEIAKGHERHHDAAHTGNAVDAAKGDEQGYRRNNRAHHQRVEAEGLVQGTADGIALNGIIGEAEGQRDEHRK